MKTNKTHQGRRISLMLICVMFLLTVSAQAQKGKRVKKAEDDVELVCAGDGKTLDEAVKMALRSGLDQTYGTFVSSNTTILNDDLIKDEIVSLSTGNVKGYEIVSKNQFSDGTWNAVVKAVFSTGKLVSYVKSKGGSTELAGGLFAMYAKMEKMNEEAEGKIIMNLQQQLNTIAPTVFDYSIQADDPHLVYEGRYAVDIQIECKLNENIYKLHDVFHNTMLSLSLTPDEVIKRKEAGLAVYPVIIYNEKDGGESGCGRMIYFEYSGWEGCEYMDKNYKLLEALRGAKTVSDLEGLVKGKTIYFLRTTVLRSRIGREVSFFIINPSGAFIVSDGKRIWVGGGHNEQIMDRFKDSRRKGEIEDILEMPQTPEILFTECYKKGTVFYQKKGFLLYSSLDELSEVKEITIQPFRDITK